MMIDGDANARQICCSMGTARHSTYVLGYCDHIGLKLTVDLRLGNSSKTYRLTCGQIWELASV